MLRDFRDFIMRGNVMDMAVGIIIGAAFGGIVASLVSDVLMPPLGLLLGGVDFGNLFFVLKEGAQAGPYATLEQARTAGAVTVNYGLFINKMVSFLLVALAVFMLVRFVQNLRRRLEAPAPAPAAPATKDCGFCCSVISAKATRCPHCTSQLAQA